MTAPPTPRVASASGRLATAFQPIVDLRTGRFVALEALLRDRAHPTGSPARLFAEARRTGTVARLDAASHASALAELRDAGLHGRVALFLNIEPDAIDADAVARLVRLRGALSGAPAVLEFTERALTARPADMLAAVDTLRSAGWGIALDDVGADPLSIALMPLVQPDVVKLDLGVINRRPGATLASLVMAVAAQRERTGALVVAEGIETPQHVATARALGATHGQGYLFARPGALPADAGDRLGDFMLPSAPLSLAQGPTPYEAVALERDTEVATKGLLLSFSRMVEREALRLGSTGILLSAFQDADRFTVLTRIRYRALADRLAMVAALGVGMEPEPIPGVRGARLAPDDPLRGEWSVVALGPHFASALVAVDLGDDGPEMERRFRFAVTHDRELVAACARPLAAKVAPVPGTVAAA